MLKAGPNAPSVAVPPGLCGSSLFVCSPAMFAWDAYTGPVAVSYLDRKLKGYFVDLELPNQPHCQPNSSLIPKTWSTTDLQRALKHCQTAHSTALKRPVQVPPGAVHEELDNLPLLHDPMFVFEFLPGSASSSMYRHFKAYNTAGKEISSFNMRDFWVSRTPVPIPTEASHGLMKMWLYSGFTRVCQVI